MCGCVGEVTPLSADALAPSLLLPCPLDWPLVNGCWPAESGHGASHTLILGPIEGPAGDAESEGGGRALIDAGPRRGRHTDKD